jgi:hypothetical protein
MHADNLMNQEKVAAAICKHNQRQGIPTEAPAGFFSTELSLKPWNSIEVSSCHGHAAQPLLLILQEQQTK